MNNFHLNRKREMAANSQMKNLESKYMEYKTFSILIASWNVNGQSPSSSLGEHWLSSVKDPPDIYAIGFQELDLSKEAFFLSDTPKEEEWLKAVSVSLHPASKYVKLKLVRLVGMMLIIFIKKELENCITNVISCTVGTGILGKMGNKGGVAVRFDFNNSSICFVNSHLAAHPDQFERRNQDYNEICNRMLFQEQEQVIYIKNHDYVYWFGDLNYRINDLTSKEVKNYIEKNLLNELIQYDQLKQQQKLKKVFLNYNEAEITFMPTYKFDPGTDQWDSSEKNRPPAWCDRILWTGTGKTNCVLYRSHRNMRLSDHKPVSALFKAEIKFINFEKHRKTYEEVMKMLDRDENEALPQGIVDKNEINFGKVYYRESVSKSIVITNTGLTTIYFEFINKLNKQCYCSEWLKLKPYKGIIEIGKQKSIELEIYVDSRSANDLSINPKKILDEILILHLDKLDYSGGRDIFITLNGKYIPSCFGSSIQCLVNLEKPLCEYSLNKYIELLKKYDNLNDSIENKHKNGVTITQPLIDFDDNSTCNNIKIETENSIWEIPKEIFILIDHLFKFGLNEEELFIQSGLSFEFIQIREALDKCEKNNLPGTIHSVAEALLIFLESLSEPVIPYKFYNRAIESAKNFFLCKQLISQLPFSHKNVFYYLIIFIRELLKHSYNNKLEANMLSMIFGKVMLRSKKNSLSNGLTNANEDRSKGSFIYHFLINDFDT